MLLLSPVVLITIFLSAPSLSDASEGAVPSLFLLLLGEDNGICKTNTDCQSSKYCVKSIGDCSGNGECTEKPLACPAVWDPVCGCDDTTYGNSCEAGLVGVTVSYSGECTVTPVACLTNTDCQSSEYCAKSIGDCSGNGECTEKPLTCPAVWDPVCGCDNTTYGNGCEAGLASVNIISLGICP